MKKLLKSPATYIVAMAIAAILFVIAGIGSTRASLSEFSQDYTSRVVMDDIGLSLLENGKIVAFRNYDKQKADGTWNKNEFPGPLLADLPENVVFEKKYPEVLTVKNTGTIDQFVRVTIYKYWVDKDGNKINTLSPDLIQLEYDNLVSGTQASGKSGDQGSWLMDETSSTTERVILYYNQLLESGEESASFTKTISISNKLATMVSQTTSEDGKTIKTTYDYDGVSFCLEVTSDAVQNHNAEDAIFSAWGLKLNVTDNTLSFGD